MSTFDLASQRVLLVGLGASGYAAARILLELGARVKVTEGSAGAQVAERAERLRALGAEVELGGHDLDALDADLAIVSPGIPPHADVAIALERSGIQVWSEIELAYRLAPDRDFLAVTGTNGKTTTTSLLAAMLDQAEVPSIAAGNIGLPLVEAIRQVPPGGAIAVEASSFQLATIHSFRAHVAVLLNIAEDHTDWHRTMQAYAAAKARIFENQGPDDVAIVNEDDSLVGSVTASLTARRVPFSASTVPGEGLGVQDGVVLWRGIKVFTCDDIPLAGVAGLEDALAAAGAALEYGIDRGAVVRALKAFRPLGHRLQLVAEIGGVSYIDDSKATNPHATLAAVRGLNDVVLIAGGDSKGIDLSPLAEVVPPVSAVVALGAAADEVEKVFEGLVEVVKVASMEEAVDAAAARSTPGGSVLLSPGCASLDMYDSYAARGEDFARCVRRLWDHGGGVPDGNA